MAPAMPAYRLGVDIGGTFTDLVLVAEDGTVATHKLPSTPDDYGRAIGEGVAALLEQANLPVGEARELVHGTTVATNAILEGRGAPTGLITTRGFRDTLEIGRLRYPRLYDLRWRKPTPLVPRRWRQEVRGRLDPRGNEVEPLDEDSVRQAIAFLRDEGVASLAVVLLHAYANDAPERRVAAIARGVAPGLPISLSSDVLPEIGEYERTSTTVVNAYLQPVVGRYLHGVERRLEAVGLRAPVLVMQSSGGVMSARAAAEHPIHVVESGPAAGVIAAQQLGARLGMPDAVTLDMGGTTAKASLVEDGALARATEYEVGAGLNIGNRLNRGAGYVLRVPAIDVAEVGAGGGSLVWLDQAGALHVGPRSAGAVPGPVCYGQGGEEPTLTDANLLLGYLNAEALLGGALPLDRDRAERAFREKVARPLGLDQLEAAHGVHRIAVASMVRVVRAVSSERGRDPRRFGLVAFGGNGPLHAAAVAAELGIGRVVVPPWPGLFSAFGLLVAEPARHFSRTVLRPLAALAASELEAVYAGLEARAREEMAREGLTADGAPSVRLARSADLRYAGQSFELRVAADGPIAALAERFEAEHERTYGHRAAGDPIERVHARVTATWGAQAGGAWPERAGPAGEPEGSGIGASVGGGAWPGQDGSAPRGTSSASRQPPLPGPSSRGPVDATQVLLRRAYFGPDLGLVDTPVLPRAAVRSGPVPGPLIVEEYDATTLVPPGWTIRRDAMNNLVLEADRQRNV
jgi:N-methylhydantoinase A